MGFDKADARIAGEILWKRQLAMLRQLNPALLFISGRTGTAYPDAGCPVITDIVPGAGPLGGLVTALRVASPELLLVLAVDMPAMEPQLLEDLLIRARGASRSVIPQGAAGFEPLAAVYHNRSLPIAEECLRAGERSMRSLITRLQRLQLADVYTIGENEMPFFRNVNTPEELAAAEAMLRGQSER